MIVEPIGVAVPPTRATVRVLLLCACMAVPAAALPPTAGATVPTTCGTTGAVTSPQDIDADGRSDLVVGVPNAGGGTGAVDVHYAAEGPAADQHVQRFGAATLGQPAAAGDRFGASVAWTDVDGNDCRDLAIGAPGVAGGRGVVVIALGSSGGVSGSGALVLHGATAGEHFGATVRAAGSDLWVSAPDRAVSGHAQAGAVDHFRVAAGTVTLVQRITESSANVPGVAESYDHFGSVLAVGGTVTATRSTPAPHPPVLFAGTPYEDVGGAKDAGDVTVLYQSAASGVVSAGYLLAQGSAGVSGHPEAGDHFGAALAAQQQRVGDLWQGPPPTSRRLYVGVPDEALGTARRAGMVQVFAVPFAAARPSQLSSITQDSPKIPGAIATGDRFGAALAFGAGCPGGDDPVAVAIGAPGERIGAAREAGTVTIVSAAGDAAQLPTCPRVYRQGVGTIGGAPETGDHFGASLGQLAEPYEQPPGGGHVIGGGFFLVGVPGEDLGGHADAGVIQQLTSGKAFYDSAGVTTGDAYGGSPASSLPNFGCFC